MPSPPPSSIEQLHADVDRRAGHLHVLHAATLQCKRGCSGCCVDELGVFEVEAAPIRAIHALLLATGAPHAVGGCAFLSADGACRIYAERPYVCRTQGLPLRWLDDDDAELRDICPLNDAGDAALVELDAAACWTLGPVEADLAALQLASSPAPRVRLRDLFAHGVASVAETR